jgi:nucleoid-associated protein YgaU
MNQLGKNVFLTLCIVATLLVILGLKRKFGGDGDAALLSQPSEAIKRTSPGTPTGSPRPRVLQAKPVTQHERAILSPTNSRYADAEADASSATGAPISPIPTPNAALSPRSLDAPELVAGAEPMTSPVTGSVGDEVPEAALGFESATLPVATRPLPEFVLTDSEDSFWSISERVYGSGVYYRALFRHNEAKVLRPDQLRPGVEVKTPALEVLRELYPSDFPKDASLAP